MEHPKVVKADQPREFVGVTPPSSSKAANYLTPRVRGI
jgi:hypothetical protein